MRHKNLAKCLQNWMVLVLSRNTWNRIDLFSLSFFLKKRGTCTLTYVPYMNNDYGRPELQIMRDLTGKEMATLIDETYIL